MNLKRGLIYLVFFLLLPIVYSQELTCDDGTRFAACKEGTNLFCSNQNLILNGGFESDSNQDGIPNNFIPEGILGTDLLISSDYLSGLKSILIKKQWSSFDYQLGGRQAITLQPNTDYLFFAFIKGSCLSPRVYASASQTGPAENELCGSNKACNLIPFGNWKRIVTQFNSNEIATTLPENRGGNPFLSFLRVECADQTPFELYVDNMHLQPLNSSPRLIENCQICGSCPSGLFCAPDGSCVSDLSNFYTDEELMERCIAENNFALCERIQDPAARPVAFNQFAVENNDITKCQDIICEQSVLYFNCLDQGRTNCAEESLSIFTRNPSFESGGDIYIRNRNNEQITTFKLGRGDNFIENKCELHYRNDDSRGNILFGNYYGFNEGTVIPSTQGNNFLTYLYNLEELGVDIERLSNSEFEGQSGLASSQSNALRFLAQDFPIQMTRNCNNRNCNLLEGNVIEPKADLLCGQDFRWHLCDRDGIKIFNDEREFLCDGETGTWVEIV